MTDAELKYRQAVEREKFVRDSAFLRVPEVIGPFEVNPMTLRHYMALTAIKSPFIVTAGPPPTERDTFIFLWQVNSRYSTNDVKAKRRFYRRCQQVFIPPRLPVIHFPWLMAPWRMAYQKRKDALLEIMADIHVMVGESLQDMPPSSPANGSNKSYYSTAAGICHELCSKYGWTVDQVMDMPLKQSLQFLKIIDAGHRSSPKLPAVMFNPSDAIRGELDDEALNRN